jgi:hypothetical protein
LAIALPQRRAMGYGAPITEGELEVWADKAVGFFLDGCRDLAA